MATLANLTECHKGTPRMTENQTVEYKQSWRDEFLKWVCGFANAKGGVLEIGRNDAGEVVGLPNAKKLMEDLPNKIRDMLGIIADVDLHQESGKEFLRITVEPYPFPISFKGEYHYRTGSTKQLLKGAALDQFLLRKHGRHWDGVPVPYVSQEDLDSRILAGFRQRAAKSRRLSEEILNEPDGSLIEKLRLTEGEYLKRATVLLFHPDPESFVTGAFVKIGFFRTNADLLYHDEIHGDLFTQVDKTMDLLLTKYLKATISYEGVQRVETLPMPEEALREAVLNAIAHKDYGSSVPIQISVYDDKVMIWNPGQLPEDWTVEKLTGKHSSEPYNPDIANAFFRAGMIEAWGRGIERIIDGCVAAEVPEPGFKVESTGLWVEFGFGARFGTEKGTTQETTQETSERILVLLSSNPKMTRQEIARSLGDISEDGVKYHLSKLKEAGRLTRIGSTKSGHWEVVKD